MTDTTGAAGTDVAGKSKPSPAEVIKATLTKVTELNGRVGELEASRTLVSADLAEVKQTLDQVSQQLEAVTASLFVALTLHLDLVAPQRENPDPKVREEANSHMSLAMQGQARIMPEYYEEVYGISASTGEVLPGRTAGVPLNAE